MGTMSGGDGGGWPPDELPELPPEWGTIVIPDDASELAQEATKVRRELRRQVRQRRWRRRLHLPPPRPRDNDEEATTLGVPLLVISIAVISIIAGRCGRRRPVYRDGSDQAKATGCRRKESDSWALI